MKLDKFRLGSGLGFSFLTLSLETPMIGIDSPDLAFLQSSLDAFFQKDATKKEVVDFMKEFLSEILWQVLQRWAD